MDETGQDGPAEAGGLRRRLADDLRDAMRGRDALAVSTLRLAVARMRDADIAARPRGADGIGEAEIVALLRSMIKQRAESAALYRQGGREELARKELDESAILARYLPAGLDAAGHAAAIEAAIAATGASGARDTGRVMAALKERHGASLDMAEAGRAVRARLG